MVGCRYWSAYSPVAVKKVNMWVKPSKCESHACVEVAFRRSTRCETAYCVEVAAGPDVLVRDSKLGDASPLLSFSAKSWQMFIDSL